MTWIPRGVFLTLACEGRSDYVLVRDPRRYFVVFGGIDALDVDMNDTWIFDTKNERWHLVQVSGDIPEPRASHAPFSLGKYLYIFGGAAGAVEFGESFKVLGDLKRLDLETGIWQHIPWGGEEPTAVYGSQAGLFMDGSRVKGFLFGGISEEMRSVDSLFELDFGAVLTSPEAMATARKISRDSGCETLLFLLDNDSRQRERMQDLRRHGTLVDIEVITVVSGSKSF